MSFGDVILKQADLRFLFERGVLSEKDYRAAAQSKQAVTISQENFESLKHQLPEWNTVAYNQIASYEVRSSGGLWSLSNKKFLSDEKRALPGSFEQLSPMAKEAVAVAGVGRGLAEVPIDFFKGLYHLGTEALPQSLSKGPEGLLELAGMMLSGAAEDLQIATGGTGKEKPVQTIGAAKRRSGRWAKAWVNTLLLAEGTARAPRTLHRANQLTASFETFAAQGFSHLDTCLQGLSEFLFGKPMMTLERAFLGPGNIKKTSETAKGSNHLWRREDGASSSHHGKMPTSAPTKHHVKAPAGAPVKTIQRAVGIDGSRPLPHSDIEGLIQNLESAPGYLDDLSPQQLRENMGIIVEEKLRLEQLGIHDSRPNSYWEQLDRLGDQNQSAYLHAVYGPKKAARPSVSIGNTPTPNQITKSLQPLHLPGSKISQTPTKAVATPTRAAEKTQLGTKAAHGLEKTHVGPKGKFDLPPTRPVPKYSR